MGDFIFRGRRARTGCSLGIGFLEPRHNPVLHEAKGALIIFSAYAASASSRLDSEAIIRLSTPNPDRVSH